MARKNRTGNRAARKERARAAREAREVAELEQQRYVARQKRILAALIVGTIVIASACHWLLDSPRLTGIALLVGVLVSMFYGLGRLASGVRARDRHRAGAIDFGSKK